MTSSPWTSQERERLHRLHLDPVRHSRERLTALVRHFKADRGIWSVSEGAKGFLQVSRGVARKVRDLVRERKLDWVLGQEAANSAPEERWLNDNLPQLRQWAEGLLPELARVRLDALGPVATDARDLRAVQSLLTVRAGENQRWAAHFSFETHPSYDLLLRAVPGLAAMLEECRAQAVAYRLLALDRAFKPEHWNAEKNGQLAGIRQAFDQARGQARETVLRRLWG